MSSLKSYSVESAPDASKEAFQKTVDKYGQELNIFADMAESPVPITLYGFGQDLLNEQGTLSAEEVNLAQLAVSVENNCEFCVPAHSWAADSMKTDGDVLAAAREGRDGPDARINALVNFTRAVVRERGNVRESAELAAFFDAGYSAAQVFEVISIVAYKTITNYTSALQGTQPNEFLSGFAWKKSDAGSNQKRAA